MDKRLFLWGLGNGVMMMAIAGVFWLGLAIATYANGVHWTITAAGTLVQVAGGGGLVWAAVRLRRLSGFQASELRRPGGPYAQQNRRVQVWFGATTAAQALLIAGAVFACVRTGTEPLIWPAIALVVSLHFIPLGWLFQVRPYYVTGAAGCTVALVSAAAAWQPQGVLLLAGGMAATMWLTAGYVLGRAVELAERASGSWLNLSSPGDRADG